MTPATDASEPRYVFVGGLHRSGTTLLADLLADLPGVAGLVDTEVTENEGHWLHREYPSVESFGGPGRFAHHPDAHLVEGALPAPDQVRRRIEAAWQPFWSDPTAPIRIEKSPQHLIQSRLVQELFPGSGFVMVSRHPVTVALATRKWTSIGPVTAPRVLPKLPIGTLVRHWLTAWEHFAADRDRLERVEVVRFEDLFADPTGTFSTVQAAMGLPGTVDTSSLREPPRRYDEQWRRWKRSPAGRLGARTWMRELEPRLAVWGYGFDDDLV